jgi:CMP-2-keto-3-deoxyoctulosonic acid synthetase
MSIAVARVPSVPLSIDTPEDLEKARALFGASQ